MPERVLTTIPESIVDDALGGWGSPLTMFSPEVRAAYVEALRDYDREHDDTDRAGGRRIECPVLALWGTGGPLDTWYTEEGGPLALWRDWGADVRGHALDGGHFFPEAAPEETVDALGRFFSLAD